MNESFTASSISSFVPETNDSEFWNVEDYWKRKMRMKENDFIEPAEAEELVDNDESVDYTDSEPKEDIGYEMTEDPEYQRLNESIDEEKSLIEDYLNKAENPSFEEFCTEAGLPGSFALKQKFESILKSISYEESEYSSFAKEMLNANKDFHEDELTPKQTADEKYDTMYEAVKGILDGSSLKKHAFICGSAGIGKCLVYDTMIRIRVDDDIAKEIEEFLA